MTQLSMALRRCSHWCQARLILALAGLALVPGGAGASEPGFLRGTWILQAAYEIQPDGKLVYPYGTKPQGILMVDGQGRYVVEIYGEARPKFTSPKPTPEEYRSAFLSISVHTGTAEVDAASNLLIFHVTHNANPDRDMTVQKRPYTLKGNVLTYQVPAAAEGKVNTPVSVWQRVRMPMDTDRPDPSDRSALDR